MRSSKKYKVAENITCKLKYKHLLRGISYLLSFLFAHEGGRILETPQTSLLKHMFESKTS